MYSKLYPEDEQFICSKHVEDIIGKNLKRKCIWLLLITQIEAISSSRAHIMDAQLQIISHNIC